MKHVFFALTLAFSVSAFADEMETHFDSAVETKCDQEVRKIGCGTPTDENTDTFMKCVDSKQSSLSAECKKVHQEMTKMRSHSH